jgi:hypothetical protein
LTGLDQSVLQIKTKFVSCHTADSKPVKLEVNGTVILPALVFPAEALEVTSSPITLRPLGLLQKTSSWLGFIVTSGKGNTHFIII